MFHSKIVAVCFVFINANHFLDYSVVAFEFSPDSTIKVSADNNSADSLNANSGLQLEAIPSEVKYDERTQTFQIVHKFGERHDGEYYRYWSYISIKLNSNKLCCTT